MDYDTLEQVLGKAATQYAAACQKHPVFPVVPALVGRQWVDGRVAQFRSFNDSHGDAGTSVMAVQSEELYEAVQAAQAGDYAQAKLETLHLIATALRAYELYDGLERNGGEKS